MRKYGWVKKSGAVCQGRDYEESHESYRRKPVIFGVQHRFLPRQDTERRKNWKNLSPENLLEIRIFSEDQEVCFKRSLAGEEFQWRNSFGGKSVVPILYSSVSDD